MKTVDDYRQEVKDYILNGAKELQQFCKKHNVAITPYQAPIKPLVSRENFRAFAESDTELLGECLDNNVDIDDPAIFEAIYEGYNAGLVISDFDAYAKHARNEILNYRKKHKTGFKRFEFRRCYSSVTL